MKHSLWVGIAAIMVTVTPAARAAVFDTITLTPSGIDTAFMITGTYPADSPTTPYSAPGAAFLITFVLPTTPTSLAFSFEDEVFGVDAPVTLNGIVFPDAQLAFFFAAFGGGVDVCLDGFCGQAPTSFPSFGLFGDQLFSGTVTNPVFVAGSLRIDPDEGGILFPVPEPASVALSGLGLVALALWNERKSRIHSDSQV